MTVAAPWVLWATLAAMIGVFVSHLLSVRRPPLFVLPTTRFLPPRTVRAVSMSARPTDVLLLLLRMLAVLCAGLAFAGVQWTGTREPVVNLVVIDAAAVGDDSLAWRSAIDEALQASPTTAVVLANGQVISGDSLKPGADGLAIVPSREGSLASALLAVRRAAPSIATQADSIALFLVSPLRTDVATDVLDSVRALWPGRIAMLPVSFPTSLDEAANATADSTADATADAIADAIADASQDAPVDSSVRAPVAIVRSATDDDVVSAAFARRRTLVTANTRIVRDSVTSDDTSFASTGGVLVVWPSQGAADSSQSPAVIANGRALVARGLVLRTSRIDNASVAETGIASDAATDAETDSPNKAGTIVRWPDGSAAATERALGRGCMRTVSFAAPVNDALLQPSARGVLSALSAPCGVKGSMGTRSALTEAQLTMLRGEGSLASAASFRAPRVDNEWARWLLLSALALLLAEMLLRRKSLVLSE